MQFTSLRVSGVSSQYFPLQPNLSYGPFFIKNVDGLTPPANENTIINTSKFGGYFQNSRRGLRQIILRVGIIPDYFSDETVEQARERLYWMMDAGDTIPIRISIMNGTSEVAYVTGYLKHLEMVPFSRDPELQLTFECDSAVFASPTFNQESSTTTSKTFVPVGTARTWLSIDAYVLRAANQFGYRRRISGRPDSEYLAISGIDFAVGDIVRVDSNPQAKRITRIRGGVANNIMGYIAAGSTWPMLDPRTNNVVEVWTATGPSPAGDARLDAITYTPRWWGI